MSAPAGLDLASIPERIQSEVQRAIQRSIKGVEYISSSGPSLGSTPKDILHVRGTMNLYHYRPIADELYRVPVLIVMATTNRGYILDMAPGQSFIEFLLKRGYDVYMLDWTPPKPEEKYLRMEDYVTSSISFRIAFAACSSIPASGTSVSSAIASAASCRCCTARSSTTGR
jgi:polyhydroxyalkanoate synthase